ncbi:NADH dehydrogenase subunit 2 (mitochondrion) [Cimex lectularius]|uniref:NADH-ubiquinone oxidoreductase chain 2 n=1 Tax=Cimex lectularius TaxID=79782 RepID=A0A342KAC7_CIMLE|nr:NADH dehydrogenase subunit 2 [Cimex lectularius]AMY59990.1 NADH dehydrogenase subunit 2 [Cimex lectularius]
MFKYSNKMLFFTMMILGSLLVLSSNNWLSIWMGLEINLMSFIPLMLNSKNSSLSEGCMMYFLIQTISSILLLFSILIKPAQIIMLMNMTQNIIIVSMMMKLGLPPFHYWFVFVMKKVEWYSCLTLMTWQKIAPLTILSYMDFNIIIAFIASIVANITAINQTDLRKIMALSSINHLGWMLTCMKESNTWMIYLLFYSLMSASLLIFLKKKKILFINQMNKLNNNSDKLTLSMLMMSMAGLPPFIGFMPKWMAIQYMMMNMNILLAYLMVMMSLIAVFYYLRMINATLMQNSCKNKWTLNQSKSYSSLMLACNLLLPISIFLIN